MTTAEHKKIDILLPSLDLIGAQLYAINLSKKLENLGYECRFLLTSMTGAFMQEVPPGKVIDCEAKLFGRVPVLRVFETSLRTLFCLRGRDSGTVLAVTPFQNRVLCLFRLMGLLNKRLVIESHQYPPRELATDYGFLWRMFYTKTFFLYQYADAHRTLSSGTHAFFASMGHKNARYAPNLIDLERIKRLAGEAPELDIHKAKYNVVSLGRLSRQKNLTFLLDVFSEVAKKADAHLWIIGDGEERGRLLEYSRRLALESKVTFTGSVRNPYSLLKQADAFVLTSVWEGLPQTIVEAMTLKVPVISVDCQTGPADMLGTGSERGWLVRENEKAEFADKLLQLLTAGPEKQEKVSAAYDFAASEYDIEKNASKYAGMFL